jgi:hypothetical protein
MDTLVGMNLLSNLQNESIAPGQDNFSAGFIVIMDQFFIKAKLLLLQLMVIPQQEILLELL